ncbi:hypothetical protein [Methylobacillus sp.]|uniref:hypothetical protein n=1 Tax=Methylobacillus sp. TaxID=56818 RepID=UPI003FA5A4D9
MNRLAHNWREWWRHWSTSGTPGAGGGTASTTGKGGNATAGTGSGGGGGDISGGGGDGASGIVIISYPWP